MRRGAVLSSHRRNSQMADDFLEALGKAIRERGLRPVERDTRAKLWLLRNEKGGYLALIIKGHSVRYWGLRVPVYESVRARCLERPALGLAVVFLSGEEGYVLARAEIDRHRNVWSTGNGGLEYKLTDRELSGFPSFWGAAQCAALVAAVADGIGPSDEGLSVEIFKRPRSRRGSKPDDLV